MKSITEMVTKKPWMGWLLFFGTMAIVFLLGLLASSVIERRSEALFAYTPITKIGETEARNQIWGQNFPREYDSWLRTADTTFRSKHAGSATRDFLEEDPRMVVLWAGYAFASDYKQSRGHAYAIDDIRATLRTGAPNSTTPSPQPNTCWACKSPDVPRVMSTVGAKEFYTGSWDTRGSEVINPIGCLDCHDAKTMNLHISRPALIEAMAKNGIDVRKASHQEMRSLVCAQCHVEYYFDKQTYEGVAYLTFPWEKGFSCEEMEARYDAAGFTDFVHAISKTPILKAQHPDYELFQTGIHAQRGVACADCHMPYRSEGGQKFTDHHVQSPLNNIAASCQVCHREETDKLLRDVYQRQDKIKEIRNELEIQLVRAHLETAKARELGAEEPQLQPVMQLIRQAQWRWDFATASHGGSFHAPLETARIIGNGIDRAREARLQLARILGSKGFNDELPYPEIDTKAKAQAFIGLKMDEKYKAKADFLSTVVPEWENTYQKQN